MSEESRKEEGVVVIGLDGLVVLVGETVVIAGLDLVEEVTGLDWLVVLPFQTPPVGSFSTALDLFSSLKIAMAALVAASVMVELAVIIWALLSELSIVVGLELGVVVGVGPGGVLVISVDKVMVGGADRFVVSPSNTFPVGSFAIALDDSSS